MQQHPKMYHSTLICVHALPEEQKENKQLPDKEEKITGKQKLSIHYKMNTFVSRHIWDFFPLCLTDTFYPSNNGKEICLLKYKN